MLPSATRGILLKQKSKYACPYAKVFQGSLITHMICPSPAPLPLPALSPSSSVITLQPQWFLHNFSNSIIYSFGCIIKKSPSYINVTTARTLLSVGISRARKQHSSLNQRPDQLQERWKQLMDKDKYFSFPWRNPAEEELGSVAN